MFKYLIFVFLVTIFAGCYSLKVEKLSEAKKVKDFPLVYVLPQTAFKIKVELEKTTQTPGPYKQFAAEYLGVSSIIEEENVDWKIVSVNIIEYPIPDTSCYFMIRNSQNNIAEKMQISKEGFLLSLSNSKSTKHDLFSGYGLENNIWDSEEVFFEELPIKKISKIQIDTTYRIVSTDTSTIRIPSYKKFMTQKSEAELAHDAADFIIRLRKRRAKLIMGLYEKYPDGKAFESMVSEMNIMESNYLSLFLGLENIESFCYSYDFIPGKKQLNESTILFRFSKQNGPLDKSSSEGTPVLIQISNLQNTSVIDSLYQNNSKLQSSNKGLVYRIPGRAKIKLSINKEILAEKVSMVAQYGSLHSLSSKILKNTNIILFYPELGSIKSLE